MLTLYFTRYGAVAIFLIVLLEYMGATKNNLSLKNRITYAILSEKELRIMRILLAEDEADLNQIITRSLLGCVR